MIRISATVRITIGLTCLTLSVLLAAQTLGIVPDPRRPALDGRRVLCEAIAINCSLFASRGELARIEASLRATVERNPEILSAAVRRANGQLFAEIGDHAS